MAEVGVGEFNGSYIRKYLNTVNSMIDKLRSESNNDEASKDLLAKMKEVKEAFVKSKVSKFIKLVDEEIVKDIKEGGKDEKVKAMKEFVHDILDKSVDDGVAKLEDIKFIERRRNINKDACKRCVKKDVRRNRFDFAPIEKMNVEPKQVEQKQVEKKEVEQRQVEKPTVEPKQVEPKQVEQRPAERKQIERNPVERRRVEMSPYERMFVEPYMYHPMYISPMSVIRPMFYPPAIVAHLYDEPYSEEYIKEHLEELKNDKNKRGYYRRYDSRKPDESVLYEW